jgi:beta-galactosidase
MFSLWANGATGVMWWCNSDQNLLDLFPYTHQMIERELGLINATHKPKPVLKEMKNFADFIRNTNIDLPKPLEQGVCLLTKGQDQLGAAYMSYCLAKAVGLNLKFSYAMDQELPESDLYLIPSPSGQMPFSKQFYDKLKEKVYNGADVYISADKVFLEDFEAFTGLKVIDSYSFAENRIVTLEGEEIPFYRTFTKKYSVSTAKVIATDDSGNPSITVNSYGKGKVYLVDAPIELNMTNVHNAFNGNFEKIYKVIFKKHLERLPLSIDAKDVVYTLNEDRQNTYFIAVNHSETEKELNLNLKGNYEIKDVIYGRKETIKPYDAVILKLKKRKRTN